MLSIESTGRFSPILRRPHPMIDELCRRRDNPHARTRRSRMAFRMPRLRFTRRFGKILLALEAVILVLFGVAAWHVPTVLRSAPRSAEHTSDLQSLMRISDP